MKNSYFSLLFLLLFYTLSAKATTLLSATEHSGYTTPDAAFENHCEIDSSGFVSGYNASGWTGSAWAHSKPFSLQVPPSSIQKLNATILSVKSGPFQASRAQCDAETMTFSAQALNEPQRFFVVQVPDCAPGQLNLSPFAEDLRVWVAKLCKIQY